MTDGRLSRTEDRAGNAGRPPRRTVRFEQAVYGSFPFWDKGYAVLASSPGCRPEWLAGFRAACQNLGERPSGCADAAGLFALRLPAPGKPWLVVGVSPQGPDDRGRPGALAFHGLFLTPGEYRKAGRDPFALAGALRSDWSAATRSLPAGTWAVGPSADDGPSSADDPRAARVATALARGRRVALEAPGPIDGLARAVWRALPGKARARASVTTWAFGNGNRFDLLAVPRLSGVTLDASYLDPSALALGTDAGAGTQILLPGPARVSRRAWGALGVAAVLAGAGVGLALRGGGDEIPAPDSTARSSAPARPPLPPATATDFAEPAAIDDREDADPAERRRVSEALVDLAERFEVSVGGDPGADPDPSALMELLSRDLRYRGPFLSDADRARLGRDPSREAATGLRWDALARRFADDRPLPEDFRRRSLRGQLGVLAWSFHRDELRASRRTATELAQALGDALAVDVVLRPTPLSERDPVLASYLAFLGRLARR